MIRFLVERPIAVVVSFFALLLLGITAYLQLPTSLLPESDIPEIDVRLSMPNTAARGVEQQGTSILRTSLMQLHGLENIESRSTEGEGKINLLFEHGTNISLAFIEVNEKVDMAMNRLPDGTARPLVNKTAIADIPIYQLNIFPKEEKVTEGRMAELSSFVREVIKRRIEQLAEVSMVDITGLSQSQVQIIPKKGYLESLGLNADRLYEVFQENTIDLGSVMVRDGHYRYYLKFRSERLHLDDIRNMPLNIDGRLFKLKDLADIQMSSADKSGTFLTGERRAISLAIMKQSSAKMDDLEENFRDLLAQFENDYPDLQFELASDHTSLLNFSISNLKQDLLIGGVLAFLLMLVFIRNVKPALLIGITIPVSLVISMLGFYLLGINFNIISLGGLILGLGMIIDNSIVVIDTIERQRSDEKTSFAEAAIAGTNEIVRPLITSVLTNCAVFIPLIFMSGIAGAIFYDQALSITIGVVSSLIVSILLLPPLYVLIYKVGSRRKDVKLKSMVNITHGYEVVLSWAFRFKMLTVALVVALFTCSIFLFGMLDKERLPPLTRNDLNISIDWNESLGLDDNEMRVSRLVADIDDLVDISNAWVGQQQYLFIRENDLGYRAAKLYVRAKEGNDIDAIKKSIEQIISSQYPLAIVDFTYGQNAFDAVFAQQIAPLRMEMMAADKRGMPPLASSMAIADTLRQLLPEAYINPIQTQEQIVLQVKPEQALLYQVRINDINRKVQDIVQPRLLDYFQGSQELVPIVLDQRTESNLNGILKQTFISNGNGVQIPLASLVEVSTNKTYQAIYAGKAGEYLPIDIHSAEPKKDLKEVESTMGKRADIEVNYTGSYFSNRLLVREMSLIFLVSVLLLYFILAAQFESLIQPLFVLVELPIAMSGAFLFLYLGGNSLNLMSMIGLIVMSGLIINDSILKIDAINRLREGGVPLMQAIYRGGHKRLKPIIMITLTSVGALLPTLFMGDMGSELQKPLALALIGGMLVGMLVSLFFVPLVYWFVYRNEKVNEL